MKIGEYRTNGKAVAYRRDDNSLLLWADAESMSTTRPCTDGNAEILTHGWRTMLPGEVALWCAGPKAIDWQARADAAEAEVKRLRAVITEARGKLNPTIELSNASYQEGYRVAAARVLAILGEG